MDFKRALLRITVFQVVSRINFPTPVVDLFCLSLCTRFNFSILINLLCHSLLYKFVYKLIHDMNEFKMVHTPTWNYKQVSMWESYSCIQLLCSGSFQYGNNMNRLTYILHSRQLKLNKHSLTFQVTLSMYFQFCLVQREFSSSISHVKLMFATQFGRPNTYWAC